MLVHYRPKKWGKVYCDRGYHMRIAGDSTRRAEEVNCAHCQNRIIEQWNKSMRASSEQGMIVRSSNAVAIGEPV